MLILKNQYKRTESQPDYELYLAPVEKKEGTISAPAQGQSQQAPPIESYEDDLPF